MRQIGKLSVVASLVMFMALTGCGLLTVKQSQVGKILIGTHEAKELKYKTIDGATYLSFKWEMNNGKMSEECLLPVNLATPEFVNEDTVKIRFGWRYGDIGNLKIIMDRHIIKAVIVCQKERWQALRQTGIFLAQRK